MGGNKVLAACDFVGEKVAAVLGITTPKYNYEIEQFKKIQKEKERAVEEEKSTGGWMQDTLSAQCKLAEKENNNLPIISQEGLQKYWYERNAYDFIRVSKGHQLPSVNAIKNILLLW